MTASDDRNHRLAVLREIEQRVLWLAVRMVDHANHGGPDAGGIKVGGHQASSASMVGLMTSLWFDHLGPDDKVSVKPHASPVFHAIKYLTGEIGSEWLTELRRFGGLQAYPSRTKDPDVADFSTGSVGLGAVAPLFASATRRYLEAHFGTPPSGRFVALVGDAELDEGNVWEAIADPAVQGLGDVMWVVDLNRQSLDRIVPELKVRRLIDLFVASGWHVVEAKWGVRLESLLAEPGGDAVRRRLDDMPNEEYQRMITLPGADARARFIDGAEHGAATAIDDIPDDELVTVLGDLGGHDLDVLKRAWVECESVTDRPSVVFAYTVKGWGLPIAGDPRNHSALLSATQIDQQRASLGLTVENEWDRFDPTSDAGRLCALVGESINNRPVPERPRLALPVAASGTPPSTTSTQETFGRVLTGLARIEEVASRMVTTSPDVSVSTNLGGWINKVGVFRPEEAFDHFGDQGALRWTETPAGRHIELGISEMNLFGMLGQLGLSFEHHGEVLLPIGTVYDPFVCRGLDSFIYGTYNASRFVIVGTPSGVTLSPEGGAHQSTITPSIGIELPGVTFVEPAYARAVDWLLCDGLDRLCAPEGESLYLRLSTRPISQAPFAAAETRMGPDALRAGVLGGGYRLVDADSVAATGAPVVHLCASGPVMAEVVAAAGQLADEGVAANVVDITSADRLFRAWRAELVRATAAGRVAVLDGTPLAALFPASQRGAPIVTVHDASSHALAWLGSVFGAPTVPLGVDAFGQSGSIDDLYEHFGLTTGHIVNAALAALS